MKNYISALIIVILVTNGYSSYTMEKSTNKSSFCATSQDDLLLTTLNHNIEFFLEEYKSRKTKREKSFGQCDINPSTERTSDIYCRYKFPKFSTSTQSPEQNTFSFENHIKVLSTILNSQKLKDRNKNKLKNIHNNNQKLITLFEKQREDLKKNILNNPNFQFKGDILVQNVMSKHLPGFKQKAKTFFGGLLEDIKNELLY